MEINTEIMIFLLGFVILILAGWILYLETRLKKLLAGRDGKSLEGSIRSVHTHLGKLEAENYKNHKALKELGQKMSKAIRGVNTERFDAFAGNGGGGRQSFATALIDEEGNGVVISSLYARDRVSVYAKPLVKFKSKFELNAEEKKSLEQAKGGL